MLKSLENLAKLLAVPPEWLNALITFESNFNPLARNKISGARGLIQFMHTTAQGMGFKDADDLISKYPDIDSQLSTPVYNYLKKYAPFPTKQSLYMAVFYPAARSWPLEKEFPANVKKVNPNIITVGDYVRKVEKRLLPVVASGTLLVLFATSFLLYKYFKG